MSGERIEVSFGPEGGQRVFNTIKELEDWFAEERKFWSAIESGAQRNNEAVRCFQPLRTLFGTIGNNLNDARNAAQSAIQAKRDFDPAPHAAALKRNISLAYDTTGLIASHTPRAKFLMALVEKEGAEVAAYALGFFLGVDVPYSRPSALRGVLAASYFDHGFAERIQDEKQALDELRTGWEKTFQTFRDGLEVETTQHKKLNTDAAQLLEDQKREFADLIKKETNAWAALHKTYDEQLSLLKPVQYWTKKAVGHRRWAVWFATGAICSGMLVFGMIYDLVQITVRPPPGLKDVANWHPEYWRIAVLIAAGLFGVWVVRIFVRLLLSNVHLLTDARERATMVQTYLSLLRKGALKEEDRQLILKALFRSTATGIVKDDAMPLTAVEALTRLGGKG